VRAAVKGRRMRRHRQRRKRWRAVTVMVRGQEAAGAEGAHRGAGRSIKAREARAARALSRKETQGSRRALPRASQ
jgi:hypothetical protein